jgi:hypothetical protein
MSLTESIVEDAALTWFGELGYAVGHGPKLSLGKLAGGLWRLHQHLRHPARRRRQGHGADLLRERHL